MSAHLDRIGGRLQVERTAPDVPGIALSGIGDVIVTSTVRARIESAALSGCTFATVDKSKIVRVSWADWDVTAELPPVLPESGEPEDLILAQEHDQNLSDQVGQLWELVVQDLAEVERNPSPPGRFHYRFIVSSQGRPLPDFFRASNMRYVFISKRARATLGDDALRWCRLHPAWLT